MDLSTSPVSDSTLKRKRDDTPTNLDPPPPTAKASKINATAAANNSNSLSINYLARQSQDDLPLVNKDDALPMLLQLLASYGSILDRHESLASNLGARPLGPILIKRFERCFDSPPRVVASHHKSASSNSAATAPGAALEETGQQQITWLEVIEFARSHPGQFTLSTFSEGKRVCQFYYPQKQLRVQISEEDFLFINSGRCQELIPPLPIWEDEEKEVATCDVLEAKLKELTNVADTVAARTRQLSHRLKGRRAAILERRADGGYGTPAKASAIQTTTAPPSSATSGFTAVNSSIERHGDRLDGSSATSATVRLDLLRHFESLPQNQSQTRGQLRRPSISMIDVQSRANEPDNGRAPSVTSSMSPAPHNTFVNDQSIHGASDTVTGGRSSSTAGQSLGAGNAGVRHNFSRPLAPAVEERQPFRPLCQAHMDSLPRGQRVLPPCDRCRRLRMDCVKNLTSCAGCTKKHARCHWREVSREELGALDHLMDSQYALGVSLGNGSFGGDAGNDESDDDDSNPLEDLEALGEKEEREVAERLKEDDIDTRHVIERAQHEGQRSSISMEPNRAADIILSDLYHQQNKIHTPSSTQLDEERRDIDSPHHDLATRAKQHEGIGGTAPRTLLSPLTVAATATATATAVSSATALTGDKARDPAPFDISNTHHGGFRAVNESPTTASLTKSPHWQTV